MKIDAQMEDMKATKLEDENAALRKKVEELVL